MSRTTERRVAINFPAVARESGLRRGKIARSIVMAAMEGEANPRAGWCVMNTHGDPGPDLSGITPPELEPGETGLRIDEKTGEWVFTRPAEPLPAPEAPINPPQERPNPPAEAPQPPAAPTVLKREEGPDQLGLGF